MLYNKLGRTGLDCSILGFGTWQIGGGRWKSLSESNSVELLRFAKERGINIFDVAAVFDFGHHLDEMIVVASDSDRRIVGLLNHGDIVAAYDRELIEAELLAPDR